MIGDWLAGGGSEGAAPALALKVVLVGSILLVLSLVGQVVLGRRRALIRSGLWNAVLLALILQPAVILRVPRLRITCLPAVEANGDAARPAGEGLGLSAGGGRSDDPGDSLGAPVGLRVGRSTDKKSAGEPSADGVSRIAPAVRLVFGLYVTVASLLLIRLIVSLRGVGRLKEASVRVDEPEWTRRLEYWRARLGIARPVRLLRSVGVRIPLVLGWFRPAIIIPLGVGEERPIPESRINAILLHELAHLRRGDDGWNLLLQFVRVVYWPHPLIWLMDRIIADVREQACDDLCVRWLGGARGYRPALIAAAMRLLEQPTTPAAPALAMARASASALIRRLRWIERTGGRSSCVLAWPGRVGIAVAVVGAALGLATIEPARAQRGTAAGPPDPQDDPPARANGTVRAYASVPKSAAFDTVALTVLDDENGRPLADVEVRILNDVDFQTHVFRTDAHGRLGFEYSTLRGNPTGNMELRKNGYVPLRYFWGSVDVPKPPEALILRLRRGTAMGGIVVAAADRPVEGVTVVMTVNRYGQGKRPANPTGQEIFYEVPLRTGPDGRWRTDSVPPGAEEVSLQLIHPDFVSDGCRTEGWAGRKPALSGLRDQSDRQVLLKGVEIRGRVVDEQGRPIAGARVVDSTRGLVFLDYVWKAVTDAEGRFHIHLPRGKRVRLTVQAQGRQPAALDVSPDPDHPEVEFRLPPGKRLRGRFVDPSGNPIAEARLHIPPFPFCKGISFNTRTDAEGRFEWDGAPGGAVQFIVDAPGFQVPELVGFVASDHESVIKLKPAVDVRLKIVDGDTGKAIPQFLVRLGMSEPGEEVRWGEPISNLDAGLFRRQLDPAHGPYQIQITADGYTPARYFPPAGPGVVRDVIPLTRAAP